MTMPRKPQPPPPTPTHGGARPGAGPKPRGDAAMVHYTIRLPVILRDTLRRMGVERVREALERISREE